MTNPEGYTPKEILSAESHLYARQREVAEAPEEAITEGREQLAELSDSDAAAPSVETPKARRGAWLVRPEKRKNYGLHRS